MSDYQTRITTNRATAEAVASICRAITFGIIIALCILCVIALVYMWFFQYAGYTCVDIGSHRYVCYPK